ncbi:MAG: ABC transporter permease, partial [Candidatus Heimdallarchaeaceae archaeon]
LYYLDFSLTSDFAESLYNLLAPILTWLGLTLLLIRGLEKILYALRKPMSKFYKFFFKDLSSVITRNIMHKPQRISKITIILSLTLSFGLVVAVINETYEQGAIKDAQYLVGSDIRISFPSVDYLDYNTSDFMANLEGNFSQEIAMTTPVYGSSVRFGRMNILIIGIEPETFFDVCVVEDSFFQTNSLENVQQSLLDNSTGSYNNIIFSYSLANPTTQDTQTDSKNKDTQEQQTFSIGDIYPLGTGENKVDVYISDIAFHFPSVSDLTGIAENELKYVVVNVEFLKNPIPSSNTTFLTNENATVSFLKLNEGYDAQVLAEKINDWYNENYPYSSDIVIETVEDKIESYTPLLTSLTGLTSMEFILVLAVSSLGLEIFMVSSLYERKREFGTYYAIGGSTRDVRNLILGEIMLISGFSLLTGVLLASLISFMYLGFVSTLLVLEVTMIAIPYISIIVLISLSILASIVVILFSGNKLSKLDPVNILRAV